MSSRFMATNTKTSKRKSPEPLSNRQGFAYRCAAETHFTASTSTSTCSLNSNSFYEFQRETEKESKQATTKIKTNNPYLNEEDLDLSTFTKYRPSEKVYIGDEIVINNYYRKYINISIISVFESDQEALGYIDKILSDYFEPASFWISEILSGKCAETETNPNHNSTKAHKNFMNFKIAIIGRYNIFYRLHTILNELPRGYYASLNIIRHDLPDRNQLDKLATEQKLIVLEESKKVVEKKFVPTYDNLLEQMNYVYKQMCILFERLLNENIQYFDMLYDKYQTLGKLEFEKSDTLSFVKVIEKALQYYLDVYSFILSKELIRDPKAERGPGSTRDSKAERECVVKKIK